MNRIRRKSAFTLIELLVVISIILIASSIIFIGAGGGEGAALSSSLRITSGIAKGARGQAILKNARTRLIIHNDIDTDIEKFRRFFGIIYEEPADSGQWIAATQGTYLPEGIYFNPDRSGDNSDWSVSSEMVIEFPKTVAKAEGSGERFYYYEFNSNGTMANAFNNNWLVIGAGTLRPDITGTLDVVVGEEQEALVGALIFRRVGVTTPVTDPAAIN